MTQHISYLAMMPLIYAFVTRGALLVNWLLVKVSKKWT